MKKILILALILSLGLSSALLADDPGNPGDILGGGGSGSNSVGAPVDGGASLLAIAGIGAAARALRNRRKKKA
jgi:hypothetical protein